MEKHAYRRERNRYKDAIENCKVEHEHLQEDH
jgi:hypothetical protein